MANELFDTHIYVFNIQKVYNFHMKTTSFKVQQNQLSADVICIQLLPYVLNLILQFLSHEILNEIRLKATFT